ncbi:MAG: hypothetical protein NZ992_00570, partial [Candidatus Korarchaeum sp.]|nr:hypothetical protein [Candidatus Korarchaeum sp.]MDW8035861.1 hypothetical protein [Candidatus Korarchaeum sp.]
MNPRAFRKSFKSDKARSSDPANLPLGDLGIYFERFCGTFRVYGVETLINLPFEDLGFLSFHFSASKVSTLDADPKLFVSNLLLPKGSPLRGKIVEDIEREARRYNSGIFIKVNESEYLENPI